MEEFGTMGRRSPGLLKAEINKPSWWIVGDQNARTADSGSLVHGVLEWNKDSFRNWAKGCYCYILAKNPSAFCQCSENLNQAEF